MFRLETFEDETEASEKKKNKNKNENASRRASDPEEDRTSADALGEGNKDSKTKWRAWRARGVGAASATAKLAGAVSAKLAGAALGRELARSAADALDAEREVATVRLPAVSEGCEAARAKAAARGGFGVAGACAVRAAAAAASESLAEDGNDDASGSSIRVVAVNGDALLCEYTVRLDKKDTCGPVLERDAPLARAAETRDLATDLAAFSENASEFAEDAKTAAVDGSPDSGSPDSDAGLYGPVTLDPAGRGTRGMDLSASMSASMGTSVFLAKKE